MATERKAPGLFAYRRKSDPIPTLFSEENPFSIVRNEKLFKISFEPNCVKSDDCKVEIDTKKIVA